MPRSSGWKTSPSNRYRTKTPTWWRLLKALAEHPMVEALNMGTEAAGQQSLANQLAYLLPFAEVDKIDLLQLDDPQQRLDAIQALLDELQGELFA